MKQNAITTVIIEDEPKTSCVIEDMLGKFCPQITLCGKAGDFETGLRLIREKNPALVFLDIQLNSVEGTGLDIAQTLRNSQSKVIFISGYREFAVDAFRHAAVDYLLKPVRIQDLVEAVDKFSAQLNFPHMRREEGDATLHIPTAAGTRVLRQKNIVRCEANGAYTNILTRDEKFVSSLNLGEIEKRLVNGFLRIHKSHLVNRDHVLGYSRSEGLLITMSDKAVVPVSRSMRDAFFQWME